MGEREAKTALFDEFARIGHALASGKRLELLNLLVQAERSVDALASATNVSISLASSHLQKLKHANLVTTRRAGTKIYYRLADDNVAALFHLIRTVAHQRLPEAETARATYHGPDVDQVTREELLRRAEAGEILVIDVRPPEEYAAGHIPGALGVPLDELPARLDDLPEDQDIVAYCRGAYCVLAHHAVRLLTQHGRKAQRLTDGMLEWRVAELPIAS